MAWPCAAGGACRSHTTPRAPEHCLARRRYTELGWCLHIEYPAVIQTLVPIGLGAVIGEDFGAPRAISHVRPVILVETGSALKQLLIDVQDELSFDTVYGEGTPGDGKQFISHTQEPPERKNRVSDAALFHVDHQMLDCSEILFLTVDDLIACKSVCRHNTLHPLSFGVCCL